MKSSILSMKRVRISENFYVIICGLSNGDMYLLMFSIVEGKPQIDAHAELNQVHDFGVNSIDAKYID